MAFAVGAACSVSASQCVPPGVYHPPKAIWASEDLCFAGMPQGLALLMFST